MWVYDLGAPRGKTLKTHLCANSIFCKWYVVEYYLPPASRKGGAMRFIRLCVELMVYGIAVLFMLGGNMPAGAPAPYNLEFYKLCSSRLVCRTTCVRDDFPLQTCSPPVVGFDARLNVAFPEPVVVHQAGNVFNTKELYRYRTRTDSDLARKAYEKCQSFVPRGWDSCGDFTPCDPAYPKRRVPRTDVCFPPCADPADPLVGSKDTRPECTGREAGLLCVLPTSRCEFTEYDDEDCFGKTGETEDIFEDDYCISRGILWKSMLMTIVAHTVLAFILVYTTHVVVEDIQDLKTSALQCTLQWLLFIIYFSIPLAFASMLYRTVYEGRQEMFLTTVVVLLVVDQLRSFATQTVIWYCLQRRCGKVPLIDESTYVLEEGSSAGVTILATKIVEAKPFEIGIMFTLFLFTVVVLMQAALAESLSLHQKLVLGDLDSFLLSLFVVEIAVKYAAYGLRYFWNRWNFFDAAVILACVIVKLQYTRVESAEGGMKMAVLRLLRVLRSAIFVNKTRSEKKRPKTTDHGVSITSPVERVLETLKEVQETKNLSHKTLDNIEWAGEIISSNKLYEMTVDTDKSKQDYNIDHEIAEVQKIASDSAADAKSFGGNELENFIMGRSKRKTKDDGGSVINDLLGAIPFGTRDRATSYLQDRGDSWDFDIFEFRLLCANEDHDGLTESMSSDVDLDCRKFSFDEEFVSMLPLLLLHSFRLHDVYAIFELPPASLVEFARKIEVGYDPKNAYHNPIHASNVLQASSTLLLWSGRIQRSGQPVLNVQDRLCLLLAAVVIDYKHPGLNNAYLVKIQHPIAVMYNDTCVLENYHVSSAFKTMFECEADPLQSIGEEQFQAIRKSIIKVVLSTNQQKFQDNLLFFRNKVTSSKHFPHPKAEDKEILLKALLEAADVSFQARPLTICLRWVVRYMEELFRQADEEESRKMPSKWSRRKTLIPQAQIAFMDAYGLPMFTTLGKFMPEVREICEPNLVAAKAYFREAAPEYTRKGSKDAAAITGAMAGSGQAGASKTLGAGVDLLKHGATSVWHVGRLAKGGKLKSVVQATIASVRASKGKGPPARRPEGSEVSEQGSVGTGSHISVGAS